MSARRVTLNRRCEFIRGGRGRHVLEKPAERARAVQRPLRSAQQLDAAEIEQTEIEAVDAERKRRARADRQLVDVDSDGGARLRSGRNAAYDDLVLARAAACRAYAGEGGGEVLEARCADAFELLPREHRHARGNRARELASLARRDDDLFDPLVRRLLRM